MNRKISINVALSIVIIAMAVTFSVAMIFSQNIFESTVASVRQKEQMYEKIAEIDKTVREEALYTIDDVFLFDMLATGYIAGIADPYARYYTVEQYVDYLNKENGTYINIGINIYKLTSQYPIVEFVYPGSPAAELGIEVGNTLREINGIDLRILSQTQIENLLFNSDGSQISLSYVSLGGEIFDDVNLQHRIYDEPTIQAIQRENEVVGYIKIIDFKSTTAREISDALEIMQESQQGLSALIIDVRNNNESNIENVVSVIDELCPTGTIGYQINASGEEVLLGLSDDETKLEIPMSVIVNENTMQGAELFALTMKELSGAQIVGTSTAGMANVQNEPVLLSDGSAISYTVGTLISSLRTEFNQTGISPDVEVHLRDEDEETFYFLTLDTDLQIVRARELVLNMLSNSGAMEDDSENNIEIEPQEESQAQENSETSETSGSTNESETTEETTEETTNESESTEN